MYTVAHTTSFIAKLSLNLHVDTVFDEFLSLQPGGLPRLYLLIFVRKETQSIPFLFLVFCPLLGFTSYFCYK